MTYLRLERDYQRYSYIFNLLTSYLSARMTLHISFDLSSLRTRLSAL
nr:MAG TPA: hypothetical protein [Caudoviricetes sp.]